MAFSATLPGCLSTAEAAPPLSSAAQGTHEHQSQWDVASVGEDALLEVVKQMEAGISSTLQGVSNAVPDIVDGSEHSEEEAALARELVKEVWEVVDVNFLDARERGFDRDRWRQLRDEALAQPLRTRSAAHRAIRTMLARGLSDPYTRFMTPQEFESMRRFDVTGVGLNLSSSAEYVRKLQRSLPRGRSEADDGVWVLGLIQGSAAESAGIQQGDEILAIDGVSSSGRSAFEVSSAIQGDKGSGPTVRVTVAKRDGDVRTVELRRPQQSKYEAGGGTVVTTDLRTEDGRRVGYMGLRSFTARAQAEVARSVRDLEDRGAQELVLDLRDNRGGLVTGGVEVARLFLDPGATVVITKGPPTRPDDRVTAAGPPLSQVPLTLLVNEHTASASEILAGALHDNCRAVLVGSRTYGKGLIQSVYELSDTSGLVITVGKYLTPAGINIDTNGIEPDFDRMPSAEAREDALNACRLRR